MRNSLKALLIVGSTVGVFGCDEAAQMALQMGSPEAAAAAGDGDEAAAAAGNGDEAAAAAGNGDEAAAGNGDEAAAAAGEGVAAPDDAVPSSRFPGACNTRVFSLNVSGQRYDHELEFAYDEDGRWTDQWTLDAPGASPSYHLIRTLDGAGLPVTIHADQGDDGHFESTVLFAREPGREREITDEGNDGALDRIKVTLFDAQGRPNYEFTDADADGLDDVRVHFLYTELGHLDARVHINPQTRNLSLVESFLYDAKGRLVQRSDDEGADGSIDLIESRSYDALGNMVERVEARPIHGVSGGTETVSLTTLSHDSSGNVTDEVHERFDGSEGFRRRSDYSCFSN